MPRHRSYHVTGMTPEKVKALYEKGKSLEGAARLAGVSRKTFWMWTKEAGLDGVVCSAQEAALLKSHLGHEFKLITPGIRPAGAELGDQRRVLTPVEACAQGSDYLVIGRPITQAADPAATLLAINQSLA